MSRLKYFCFFLLFCIPLALLKAQGNGGFSGTEFWISFGSNVVPQEDTTLHVILVSSTDDTVELKNPITNATLICPVKANVPKRAFFNNKTVWQCWAPLDLPVGGAEACAVRIRSKRDIQVFAANPFSISNDVTSLLPVQYLEFGQDYIISSKESSAGREGRIVIVALDPGSTKVSIKSPVNNMGASKNITRNIPYAHAFMIGTDETTGSYAGTTIKVEESCKRIAVFTSVKCAENGNSPGCSSCDLLMEQSWPTLYFNKQYIIPSVPDNNGYTVQILAKFNNTTITLDGTPLTTLQANESYTFDQTGSADHYLSSNNPIGVTQITKSYGCAGHPRSFGDPGMLNIAPLGKGVKKAYLGLFDDALYAHYAKLVAKSNQTPVITVNGMPLNPVGGFKTYNFGGENYYIGYAELLPRSSYFFESDFEFQGYYYGMGDKQGASTCFATAFVNRNTDFTLNPSNACDTSEKFTFTAVGDSISNIQWQFGDGKTSNQNPVVYSYSNTGKYNVKLLSFRSSAYCQADTLEKTVNVYQGPQPVLPKDTMPCNGTFYKLELPDISGVKYTWADGGVSTDRTFIKSEDLVLILTDSNNCVTMDSMSIKFQECKFQKLKLANVFTPNKDGKNDRWRVISEGYEKVDVRIYNRWGQLMYAYDAVKEEHWNGSVNNLGFSQCPDGTYFYQIAAFNKFDGSTKTVGGTVRIIR